MALPRLTELVPVIFAFNASNPPGMSRFLATCMAATHCPRFLNPEHALLRLPPGTEIPLFSRALVSEVSNLPLSRTLLGDSDAALECPIPFEPMLLERPLSPRPTSDGAPVDPGATPAGRPPPAPCWANADTLNASIAARIRREARKVFFISVPPSRFPRWNLAHIHCNRSPRRARQLPHTTPCSSMAYD